MKKLFALLFTLLVTCTVMAQDNPTVEIVLSQPTAQQGAIITADIYVRNGIHVAGIDIGISVDNVCLRIVDRQPGNYLPTTSDGGAFSPFSELNEHDTRLAAALTDRSKNASGDGVFYYVQLEVTCETGTAPIEFTYAKLSTYADPEAESISLISYDLSDGTLNAINTQLTIDPAGQAVPVPTSTAEAAVIEQQPVSTSVATLNPLATTTPVPLPISKTGVYTIQNPTLVLIIIVLVVALIVLTIILLVFVFLLGRKSSRTDRKE